MLLRPQGNLGLLTVALAAVIAGLTVTYFWASHLPHPDQATQTQLLRWLVQRDLASEPKDLQVALVNRLEAELANGAIQPSSSQGNALTTTQQERLNHNLEILQRVWFFSRSAEYETVERAKRMPFLKDRISVIQQWSQLASDPSEGSGPSSGMAEFFEQLEQWLGEAQSQQLQCASRAVRDGLVCWLATSDLQEQSLATRTNLAIRIAAYLDKQSASDWTEQVASEANRDLLVANGQLLLEAWMHDQAERVNQLDQRDRTPFIDRQIERFLSWDVIELLAGTETDDQLPVQSKMAAMTQLAELSQTWIERADPERRPRLQYLLDNLRQRLMWHQLRAIMREPT